ncbi:MAG: sulfotransferase family protein, partial [Salinispira sp.]
MIWCLMSLSVYPMFLCLTWLLFFVDDIFRPSVKRQKIDQPLFIVGNFRCGSTFLQRLLASDAANFSSCSGWEVMFVPSFSGRQFIQGIFIVDRWIGSPLRYLVAKFEQKMIRTDNIHKVALREPEEDESLFIPAFTSAFLMFISPDPKLFREYYTFDTHIPPRKKMKNLQYYDACVKRHMRFHRKSRHYLSKSPTFTMRCLSLRRQFPDARFIYLLRNPLDLIPSLMTWFSQNWSALQKKDARYPHWDFVMDFVKYWYIDSLEILSGFSDEQVMFVMYDDLVSSPLDTLTSIYSWLNIELSEDFQKYILQTQKRNVKGWKEGRYRTDDIDFSQIREVLAPVF